MATTTGKTSQVDHCKFVLSFNGKSLKRTIYSERVTTWKTSRENRKIPHKMEKTHEKLTITKNCSSFVSGEVRH